METRVVVFEAWNISRFVSITNKRREIAGASELITYLDRRWVREAVRLLQPGFDDGWRIEDRPLEILETGAGTAKVLVRDEEEARGLVREVTLSALRAAPGLEVCGVVSEPFTWSEAGALHEALNDCFARLGPTRRALPGPDARFLRLPVTDECATTGLPAAELARQPRQEGRPEPGWEPRSAESQAKWRAFGKEDEGDGLHRLAELAHTTPEQLKDVVRSLGEEREWVGVVYADGNGLGKVFGAFDSCVEGDTNRAYTDTLRAFSSAMQRCAADAFGQAVDELSRRGASPERHAPPVLPLILGGDDLVALCAGEWTLPFTVAYLQAFERLTAEAPDVRRALEKRGLGPGLSMSAGVAVVKGHFPFQTAQALAYKLMREAKVVKSVYGNRPCSSLSYHVVYDSTDVTLPRIRSQQKPAPDVRLTAQPYLVSEVPEDDGWARGRRWADLERRVAALAARDDEGERALPATQLHDLRTALFAGPEATDARYANLRRRFGERGLAELEVEAGSLFWRQSGSTDRPLWITGLLDAMDAEGFLGVEA